jgi:hypothetical protein
MVATFMWFFSSFVARDFGETIIVNLSEMKVESKAVFLRSLLANLSED